MKQKSLFSRMNFNTDFDNIFLLENYHDFESIIKEIPWSQNDINTFFNTIIVQYEFLGKLEEKKCLINSLKNYFDFIKIIYKENNNINFLILNNNYYSGENIINKINDKAVLGKEIKTYLNINEFPLDNYILEEINKKDDEYEYYDKIFILKEKNLTNDKFNILENINNINNENNKNNDINKINFEINNINYLNDNYKKNNIIYNNTNNENNKNNKNNKDNNINNNNFKINNINDLSDNNKKSDISDNNINNENNKNNKNNNLINNNFKINNINNLNNNNKADITDKKKNNEINNIKHFNKNKNNNNVININNNINEINDNQIKNDIKNLQYFNYYNNENDGNNINNENNKIKNDNNNDDMEKKIKIMMEQNNQKFLKMEKNLNYMKYIFNSIFYKEAENYYKRKFLNNYINKFPNNENKEYLYSITFERHVYIYCKSLNKYLYMTQTNNRIVKGSDSKYPWDIQINFSNKTIIFCSNNYYLGEKNGDIIGGTKLEKWYFELDDNDNYYFKNSKRKNNNILSLKGQGLKANKEKAGNNEKFQLIEIPEDNVDYGHSTGSNISAKIDNLFIPQNISESSNSDLI